MRRQGMVKRFISLALAWSMIFTTFGGDVVHAQAAGISENQVAIEQEIEQSANDTEQTQDESAQNQDETSEIAVEDAQEQVSEEASQETAVDGMQENEQPQLEDMTNQTEDLDEKEDGIVTEQDEEIAREDTTEKEEEAKQEDVAFSQREVLDHIVIQVEAPKGVFPAGAKLVVKQITNKKHLDSIEEKLEDAVEKQKGDVHVEEFLLYDITIINEDGKEIQPDESKGKVKVSFANVDVDAKEVKELQVFHVNDKTEKIELLETKDDVAKGTAEAMATHFSEFAIALLAEGTENGDILINGEPFVNGEYKIHYGDQVKLSLVGTKEDDDVNYYYLSTDVVGDIPESEWDQLETKNVTDSILTKDGKDYCVIPVGSYYLAYYNSSKGEQVVNSKYKLVVEKAKIGKPSVEWDGKKATWQVPTKTASDGYLDPAAISSQYALALYKGDTVITKEFNTGVAERSYSFNDTINKEFGSYCFYAISKTNNEARYIDSDPSYSAWLVYKDEIAPVISAFKTENSKLVGTAQDAQTGIYAYAFSTKATAAEVESWTEVESDQITMESVSYSFEPTQAGEYYFYVKDKEGNCTRSESAIAVTRIIYHGYSYVSSVPQDKVVMVLGSDTVTLPSPSRKGFTFCGWTKEGSDEVVSDFDEAARGKEITYVAKWNSKSFAPTIEVTGTPSKVYDGEYVTLKAVVPNKDEDASSVQYKWYKDDVEIEGATEETYQVKDVKDTGNYKVFVSVELESESNPVEGTSDATTVAITKKDLTVSIKPCTITYGEDKPVFEYKYDTLAKGDTAADIQEGTASCSYVKGNNAGEYEVSLSGFEADNYNISYNNSVKLVVAPLNVSAQEAGIVIDLSNSDMPADGYIYDGTPKKPVIQLLDRDGNPLEEDQYELSEYKNNINAGTATVVVTMKGNYTGSIQKDFTIKKAEYEASVSISTWKYGDYSVAANGPGIIIADKDDISLSEDDVTYYYREDKEGAEGAWTTVRPEDVGSYKVKAEIKALANYNAYVTPEASFSITKRYILLQTKSNSWPYDGKEHSEKTIEYPETLTVEGVSYTNDGFYGSDSFQTIYARTTVKNVTTELVKNAITTVLTSSTKAGNYEIIKDEGILEVTADTLKVPSNLAWSDVYSGTATWVGVSKSKLNVQYQVQLFRQDGPSTYQLVKNGEEDYFTVDGATSLDLKEVIRQDCANSNKASKYFFKVKAVPAGGENQANYAESSYSGLSTSIATAHVMMQGDEGANTLKFDDFAVSEQYMVAGETLPVTVTYVKGFGYTSPAWTIYAADKQVSEDINLRLTRYYYSEYSQYSVTLTDITEPANYELYAHTQDAVPYAYITFEEYTKNHCKVHIGGDDSKGLSAYRFVRYETDKEFEAAKTSLEKDDDWIAITEDQIDKGEFYDYFRQEQELSEAGYYYMGIKDDKGQIRWSDAFILYEIRFNKGDDNATGTMSSIMKAHDRELEALPTCEFLLDGAAFTGWKDSAGKLYADGAAFTANKSMELTATWNSTPCSYTVEYYYMNKEGEYPEVPSDMVEYQAVFGSKIDHTTKGVKKNVTGMSLDETVDGSCTEVIVSEVPDENVLKLYYKRNTYTLSYSYREPNQETDTVISEEYMYGADLKEEIAHPEQDGYDFVGWEYDAEGIRPATMPGYDVHATGRFVQKPASYQVNYYVENLDGTAYVQLGDPEIKKALHDEPITFETSKAVEQEGFTISKVKVSYGESGNNDINGASTEATGVVSALGGEHTLQVNYFYTRNSYDLTLYVWKTPNSDDASATDIKLYEAKWTYKYEEVLSDNDTFNKADAMATYYENVVVAGNQVTDIV